MRVAENDILAFVDDDAEVIPDWLSLIAPVYDDTSVAAVGGPISVRWNPEPPAWSIDLGTFGELSYGSDYYQLQPGEAMNAANLTTRRSIFVELGGFNPGTSGNTIIVGDLEVGLCRKLMAAGWKLVYVPGALVYHLQDGSRVTLERMRFRHTQQTRFIAYQD